MVGWMLAMMLRQLGHFVFEPRIFDAVNGVSHDFKESVKVGCNLQRKVVLLAIWCAAPKVLWANPGLMQWFGAEHAARGLTHCTAIVWFCISAGAVVVRTLHLFRLMSIQ